MTTTSARKNLLATEPILLLFDRPKIRDAAGVRRTHKKQRCNGIGMRIDG
jgi:hypothetical protein